MTHIEDLNRSFNWFVFLVSNLVIDASQINKKLELIEGEGKYTEIEYEYTPFSEEQHGEHHHH